MQCAYMANSSKKGGYLKLEVDVHREEEGHINASRHAHTPYNVCSMHATHDDTTRSLINIEHTYPAFEFEFCCMYYMYSVGACTPSSH